MTRWTTPTGEQYRLAAAEYVADVVEVGGGLRRLRFHGRDLVDGYARGQLPTGARGALLSPWPNRIPAGRYRFAGVDHQLALTEPARGVAIHGLLRWSPFALTERTPARVSLAATVVPQPGYPFPLQVGVTYALSEAGLAVEVVATNLGASPCPYATGHHPYLATGPAGVDAMTLRVPAATVLEVQFCGAVTGRGSVAGTTNDFRAGHGIGAARLDTTWTDLERDPDGLARVVVVQPGWPGLCLWCDPAYGYLQVYTGDTLEVGERRRGLAVEPMTCPPGAFASGESLVVLEPGQSHRARWGLGALSPAADAPLSERG